MNERAMNLEFNYAIINLQTGECLACMTFSYEIINDAYISVPHAYSEYRHKYYNFDDGLFYYEQEYITVFDPETI